MRLTVGLYQQTQIRLLVAFMSLSFVSACTVGPTYQTPRNLLLTEQFDARQESAVVGERAKHGRWWEAFGDPVLAELVDQAHAQNLDLRLAALRIIESRARRGVTRSGLFPAIDAVTSGTDIEASDHNASFPGDITDYQLGAEFGWELDFWGRVRRSIEAADGQLLATEAELNNLRIVIAAEVANTYIQLRAAELRMDLAKENVRVQGRLLSNTQALFRDGEATRLDVSQAQAIFADTQALVPALTKQRTLARNGLAVLLATSAADIDTRLTSTATRLPVIESTIDVGVPADLVRQRSDIMAAEFRAMSAAASVGVAEAARRPNIVLAGSLLFQVIDGLPTPAGGERGSDLGDLLSADSLARTLAPSISLPLFDGGRRKNAARAADARYQASLEDLRRTVILALNEVESAITTIDTATSEVNHLNTSVSAYAAAYDTARIQYDEGDIGFTPVLDSLRQRVGQEQRLVQAKSARSIGMINLFRALGGGWQNSQVPLLPESTLNEMRERTQWGELLGEAK